MNTKDWINFIVKETEGALTLLYSYMAFRDSINENEYLIYANKNAGFWKVHTTSLQITLFLYLGRLSDDSKDGKSFYDFNNHCMVNIGDFSKESFLSRRGEVLNIKIKPPYLEGKSFPDQSTLANLFSIAKESNKFLRAECKTIRSKVYAHAIYTEEHEYCHLFEKVELIKIEEALLAMWSVSKHLWEAHENANTITPKVLRFLEKENIYNATRKVISGTN